MATKGTFNVCSMLKIPIITLGNVKIKFIKNIANHYYFTSLRIKLRHNGVYKVLKIHIDLTPFTC